MKLQCPKCNSLGPFEGCVTTYLMVLVNENGSATYNETVQQGEPVELSAWNLRDGDTFTCKACGFEKVTEYDKRKEQHDNTANP